MGRIRMNKLLLVLFCLALWTLSLFDTSNAAGIQKLDSKTFDGALSKADIMLAKFDQNNPDPKMHAAFEKVVSELSKEIGMENMTAAHVEVIKDGEITNSELVSKYNIKKLIYDESLPVIASFTRNKEGDKYPEGEFVQTPEYILHFLDAWTLLIFLPYNLHKHPQLLNKGKSSLKQNLKTLQSPKNTYLT